MLASDKLIDAIQKSAKPLTRYDNYSALLDNIGDARFVLLGEATHGTHEFYQSRIEITQHLLAEKDFMAVAIEGDWPDAYRIHRYLQGKEANANNALADFKRFPIWMWRNTTLPPFLQWLREHNNTLSSAKEKIGVYGLDLYSLYTSMQAVINYLLKIDPEAAERARQRYSCFDHMKPDPQTYGYLTSMGIKQACLKETIDQLIEMQNHDFDYLHRDTIDDEEEYFFATQNARIVKNAEHYYRSMFEGHVNSWNIRDEHMAETLNILADHLEKKFERPAKIIIWAHNSHVGDARATEMGTKGELNIGQLVREQYDFEAYSIGFSTYEGYVTAASEWDAPAECKKIVPAMKGSYEELFHQVRQGNFLLNLRGDKNLNHYLNISRLQRAIGVIYRPETERQSHYFFSHLPSQFDSLIHFDKTNAVQPLDVNPEWKIQK